MEDFERFERPRAIAGFDKSPPCGVQSGSADGTGAGMKDAGRPHRPQVPDQPLKRTIGCRYLIDVDDGADEAGLLQQRGQGSGLHPWMDVRHGEAAHGIGRTHRPAKLWQRAATGQRADEQGIGPHRVADEAQCERQVVDAVQCANRDDEVVRALGRRPRILDQQLAMGTLGEQRARVANLDLAGEATKPLGPPGIGAADQERAFEPALDQLDALKTIGEGALVEEHLDAGSRSAVAAHRAKLHVEQLGHAGACALRPAKRQGAMVATIFRAVVRWALDFALPPRCAGCGTIVGEVHSFCPDCWKGIEFLGHSGCSICGIPLQATEQTSCGACLARPPRIARTRAAVAYDDLSRSLAIRLKYGRRVAIARTMARYMAPLVSEDGDRLLVPVPLHRTRLWNRGFNQSALVARELSRRLGIASDPMALERTRRTPPLKSMSRLQRRKTVAGAFRVRNTRAITDKTVILVDDVLTTGSTAEACARTLKRAGAARVELVSWARVVKPSQLMR